MFLDGWKQYSLKSKLQKSLKPIQNSQNKIEEGVGVLFDSQDFQDEKQLEALAKCVSATSEISLFVYLENQNQSNFSVSEIFSKKDFTVLGAIKNEKLNAFIDKPFKILISYYHRENVFLEFVTSQSKANFKAGLPVKNSTVNDLIIKTDLADVKLFEQELVKYLKILNRIE